LWPRTKSSIDVVSVFRKTQLVCNVVFCCWCLFSPRCVVFLVSSSSPSSRGFAEVCLRACVGSFVLLQWRTWRVRD
jgi:hypothetical protein